MQLFIYSFALMIVENTPNKMTISRDTGSTMSKGKQENQSILIQKNHDDLTLTREINNVTASQKQVNTVQKRLSNRITWYKERNMMP